MTEPRLKIVEQDGLTRVHFPGDTSLDANTVAGFSKELYALVESPERKCVLVDLKEVRYMSSPALGMLLTVRNKARRANVRLSLTNLNETLRRVFELTNLDGMFEVFDNADEAAAHLRGQG